MCTQTLRGILQRILELGLFLMETHLVFPKLNSLKCNELIAQLEPLSRSHQEVSFVENKKEEKRKRKTNTAILNFPFAPMVYMNTTCASR